MEQSEESDLDKGHIATQGLAMISVKYKILLLQNILSANIRNTFLIFADNISVDLLVMRFLLSYPTLYSDQPNLSVKY